MISVCMIVRNEEELLPVAVASTHGLADEVVVVDTGSTDRTCEVAAALGCLVVQDVDHMHKARSRNLAQDAAHGDWVVVLDADERIADPAGLRAFLESTPANAFYVRLVHVDGDRRTLSYDQMRVWRRGTYRYKYRAHEVPIGGGRVEHTAFVWEHRQPAERNAWKLAYTLERLKLDVAENPQDERPLFYLGRQHVYLGQHAEAVECLERYLKQPGYDEADVWYYLARAYQHTAPGRAPGAFLTAAFLRPQRREFWGEGAQALHDAGQDALAAECLRTLLRQTAPTADYRAELWFGSHPHDLLARCLWKLGRFEEGASEAREALRLSPGDGRLRDNLLWFEHREERGVGNR